MCVNFSPKYWGEEGASKKIIEYQGSKSIITRVRTTLVNLTKVDRIGGVRGTFVGACLWWKASPHCNARVMMSRHVHQPKDLPNTSLYLDP